MFLFFVTVLLTLSYLWLKNRYSYWERLGVPGPKPVYLFGNLLKQLTFQEHISTANKRWHRTYNNVPYLGFYKMLQPAVMIRDPELQREILVRAFMNFDENDATVDDSDELIKANPFILSGDEWRHSRAMFGASFSANKIKIVFPAMLKVANEWEQYVRSLGMNTEIDAKDICSRFTTETVLRCIFSIDGKSFERQSEFLDMGKSVFHPDIITAMVSVITFFIPGIRKFMNISMVPKSMQRRFTEMIREQTKMRDSGSVQCEDVLQFVLNDRDKYQMKETDITGICMGSFIEMYETTANVLALAFYTLAKNPHIQDELARCIQESLEANNNEVTHDLIYKHEYLDKVTTECMRIQPVSFGMQKLCTKDFTMPLLPGQSEPTTIPAGTSVLIPFATVQQDPTYFPDPDYFDPERFSPEQKAQRHKNAHMPFSDGPRMCVGVHQALFNVKMGLFQMIRSFDVKLHPNNKPFKVHPMTFDNIPQDGIKLILTPREAI
ncbi:probable cytochrome P450 6a13 [Bradysia coprophila]|uniref:probable cytochrome P450 6a13 n=1 Tax=Bradysia coprophila TaxID=38358 RepID=UPI00187D9E1F|nr:probable cytochrome P450 6a13 [Bradysia coprophila]XP_037036012.1 probable cytochrome P450 6a13 [Bradysia coprophila]